MVLAMCRLAFAALVQAVSAARCDQLTFRSSARVVKAAIPLLTLPAILALLAGALVAVREVALLLREHLDAVPDPLALVNPCVVLPLVVVAARRVAACPVVVLPEALAGWVRAAPGRHAVLAIVRAGEGVAIPDVMLALVDPPIVPPLHVMLAGGIATRPVVVLPEARAAWVRAALGLPAILPVVRAPTVDQAPSLSAWRSISFMNPRFQHLRGLGLGKLGQQPPADRAAIFQGTALAPCEPDTGSQQDRGSEQYAGCPRDARPGACDPIAFECHDWRHARNINADDWKSS